jgi:glycosyltransferase involved in cell wall biosynthesis
MMQIALLIPIYQPTEAAVRFLSAFEKGDFAKVVVVDDGSGEKFAPLFQKIALLPDFEVLSYPTNGGKGHAIKYGFSYILAHYPDVGGIVTADGDGQHAKKDILQVRDALNANPTSLIMGVRDFSGKNVPTHNRLGNKFSAGYFHLATGVKLSDTQTGLRGIPSCLDHLAVTTHGERYDYEMNFLLDAVKETALVQVFIATIYDGNKSSHFHPFRDSYRIYKTPILYLLVAVASWGIDLGLFTLFSGVFADDLWEKILLATVSARLISGAFNFLLNTFVVFSYEGGFWRKLGRYSLLFFVNMGLSFGLVTAFDYLPASLTVIKIIVDLCLFIVNYFVQLTWVYARKKVKKSHAKKAAKSESRSEKDASLGAEVLK